MKTMAKHVWIIHAFIIIDNKHVIELPTMCQTSDREPRLLKEGRYFTSVFCECFMIIFMSAGTNVHIVQMRKCEPLRG